MMYKDESYVNWLFDSGKYNVNNLTSFTNYLHFEYVYLLNLKIDLQDYI